MKIVSTAHVAFGTRVRARRNELMKSQEQLARDTSIHWSYIGRVERGENNLALTNLLRIAHALDIDPAQLVSGLKPPAKVHLPTRRTDAEASMQLEQELD
jgi:transcriptional regulator with XRE-family HTH domain